VARLQAFTTAPLHAAKDCKGICKRALAATDLVLLCVLQGSGKPRPLPEGKVWKYIIQVSLSWCLHCVCDFSCRLQQVHLSCSASGQLRL
jgi:hypothetical protein